MTGVTGMICAVLMTWGCVVLSSAPADASAIVPDNQQAWLEIKGSGVAPSSEIILATGKNQKITVQSDKHGSFIFKKLEYFSFVPLSFRVDIPPTKTELVSVGRTSVAFDFDPYGSMVTVNALLSPAGTIAVSVDGMASNSQVAGPEGAVKLQMTTPLGLADGTSEIATNIINVGQTCCPNTLIPATPIQLYVSSIAVKSAPQPGVQTPNIPVIKNEPSIQSPVIEQPQNQTPDKKPAGQQQNAPKKAPAPYLITGELEQNITISSGLQTSAISFPAATYENTYVGGFKRLTDQVRNAVIARAMMIGAFLDGRAQMNALGTVGKLNARTMKDYVTSDSICKFGTLSRSLASTDSRMQANKQVFSTILMKRNAQAKNTIYAEPTQGSVDAALDFKQKYCHRVDEDSGLASFCLMTPPRPDEFINRDVNYTRTFDTPMTLDLDYTNGAATDDERRVLALFQLLGYRSPEYNATDGTMSGPQGKSQNLEDLNQNMAVRGLVDNSFANMVAMKAKGTAASAAYMHNVLRQMGLSNPDARKLIGDNPSYYAQMEIMTKKLYQDPAFYANLYDGPTNVSRQRVAMKAVSLMQDRDFLETLKRREMLLSQLLEMKLRKEALGADLRAINAK